MLVPAAPRPSRLSATPQCFFTNRTQPSTAAAEELDVCSNLANGCLFLDWYFNELIVSDGWYLWEKKNTWHCDMFFKYHRSLTSSQLRYEQRFHSKQFHFNFLQKVYKIKETLKGVLFRNKKTFNMTVDKRENEADRCCEPVRWTRSLVTGCCRRRWTTCQHTERLRHTGQLQFYCTLYYIMRL